MKPNRTLALTFPVLASLAPILVAMAATALGAGFANAAESARPSQAPNTVSLAPVGVTTRRFVPPDPSYDWRGARTHALVTTIWYPAAAGSVEQQQWEGPPDAPLFDAEKAAPDATPAASPARLPLILLSHGAGGTAGSLAWLGARLAARGYIVAAPNHPGNNALEPYTTRGFAEWSIRATDLSRVLDAMLADPLFGPRIDPARIGAAGMSIGGHTVIDIAGGIGTLDNFRKFCGSSSADDTCKEIPEFPHLVMWAIGEYVVSASFRAALRDERRPHRDARVRAVFAIAPALGPAFSAENLEQISIPVQIVAGAADPIAPVATNAEYLAKHIPHAGLTIYPGGVGHYTFLDTCTLNGRKRLPEICDDAPGVDRAAVHKDAAQKAVDFFAANLGQ